MKKFWRILKKVLMLLAVVASTVLFIVVLTSAIKHQHQLVCKNVQVNIDYDSGIAFLNEAEIKDKVNYTEDGGIIGKPLSDVDFSVLEKDINKNPYVQHAEVFIDQEQMLVVDIIQKRPIVRVINNDGVSYYISENNDRIPLSDKFTPHVAIALGNIDTHRDTKRDSTVQAALYTLVRYIRQDEFLNALVDQIYVNDNGEFDLIPRTGGHTIVFGNVDESMAEKFDRLKIFYSEGLSKTGWYRYKTINLKYEGQVVCEKRDTTNTI